MLPVSRLEKADYLNGTRCPGQRRSELSTLFLLYFRPKLRFAALVAPNIVESFSFNGSSRRNGGRQLLNRRSNYAAADASLECSARHFPVGCGQTGAGYPACYARAVQLRRNLDRLAQS